MFLEKLCHWKRKGSNSLAVFGIGVPRDKWDLCSREWGTLDAVSAVPSHYYVFGSSLKQGDGDKLPKNQ